MLAVTHLHPALSLLPAAIIAGWIVWYWWRLSRPEVPPSRRKIRRISIFLMAMSLPMFVRALSFIDPAVEPRPYVMTWLMALLMVALVIGTALLDAVNNMRLHRRLRRSGS
jgi:hypothetical protein